ncbi:hypothetical protein KSP40_PGU022196 [Platanthera guangdongensis]|uniref:Uncharacterized protein n=1 Tax=Platanthera guangdongensis TaxID=2320717 RepID=A0ABR2LRC1_9ASPA
MQPPPRLCSAVVTTPCGPLCVASIPLQPHSCFHETTYHWGCAWRDPPAPIIRLCIEKSPIIEVRTAKSPTTKVRIVKSPIMGAGQANSSIIAMQMVAYGEGHHSCLLIVSEVDSWNKLQPNRKMYQLAPKIII